MRRQATCPLRFDRKRFPSLTSDEWELAAKYKGGGVWTPGGCASGAAGIWNDADAIKAAARYRANSNVSAPDIHSTQPVGQKPASGNALGICDMNCNVSEGCLDVEDNNSWRAHRGGSWSDDAQGVQLVVKGVPRQIKLLLILVSVWYGLNKLKT